ncbi:hypothetical protein E4U41_000353, partial [Claviceps citrina]
MRFAPSASTAPTHPTHRTADGQPNDKTTIEPGQNASSHPASALLDMAVYSPVPPPEEPSNAVPPHALPPSTPVSNGAIDIDAWTVAALESLSVSPIARGTGTPLAIPIDDAVPSKKQARIAAAAGSKPPPGDRHVVVGPGGPSPSSRRDSMKRREGLLRGNEGSRQRRRWENDHLVGVPNVQPPLPSDWEVRPTHKVHHRVPYSLAQFWDRGLRQRAEEKT